MQEFEENDMVGHLEEEALKRKRKIEELRNKRKQSANDFNTDINKEKILPTPKFRSYIPSDEKLKENALPKKTPDNVKDKVEDVLELSKSADNLMDDIDLTKLAPKKIDWDLKRNIASKLEKLEKKTHRSIAELVRERLKGNDINDLDKAISDLEAADKNVSDDDD